MKKLLLSLLLVFGVATLATAQMQDVVYLNNGSIIKGKIIEKTPAGAVKIETMCGSVFAYSGEQIQSMTTEKMTSIYGKKIVDLPKHIFGIRGGALFAKATLGSFLDDASKKYLKTGFHIGGIYEVSLQNTNRWYFQTGLDFQYIRGKHTTVDELGFDDFWDDEPLDDNTILTNTKAMYIEIPAMFTCKFELGKNLLLCPAFGLAYNLGLTGKYTYEAPSEGEYETGNPFNEDGDYNPLFGRHCVSFKAALNFVIKRHCFIGCGVFAHPLFGDHWGLSATVGYNF